MKTLLRRAAATGFPLGSLVVLLARFAITVRVEKLHPLQDGIFRLKHPDERRPDLPRENALIFWSRLVAETVWKQGASLALLLKLMLWARAIGKDPQASANRDAALTPVSDDDDAGLDLMTKTGGAEAAIAHIRKVQDLTHARSAAE
jgi:hypothetical protein